MHRLLQPCISHHSPCRSELISVNEDANLPFSFLCFQQKVMADAILLLCFHQMWRQVIASTKMNRQVRRKSCVLIGPFGFCIKNGFLAVLLVLAQSSCINYIWKAWNTHSAWSSCIKVEMISLARGVENNQQDRNNNSIMHINNYAM